MRTRPFLLAAGLLTSTLALAAPSAHAAGTAAPYDFDGDGYRDLAIGAPGATVGGKAKAGAVTVVHGGATGPGTARHELLTQNTTGVPDSAESGDRFGARVLLSDTTKDGRADLSVGGTGENGGDGALWWLKSATTSGAKSFGPAKFGIATTGTPAFGAPLRG
ncbi:integrin alpha [Streptomyces sp. NPDC008159]|uniref:integrin alpha n=1 Tax=Streptomyces sp. NPDC008159 TaxID=3364817 RepID=UPI0036ECA3F7